MRNNRLLINRLLGWIIFNYIIQYTENRIYVSFFTFHSFVIINICLRLFKLERTLNKFKTHKYVKHCEMYKVEICFWYNAIRL